MIRVLDKNVADKIAAGEVVERPLSIVKELVENSIDAGADSITIEINNGGKSYIRVTDNGSGINADEVLLAFKRHATSKIFTDSDLDAIETLGFRGEALASIVAVSRCELITKTAESKVGMRVNIEGSEVIESNSLGCPTGTTIIVSDLFFNTPARKKFMKADSTESSLIIDFISKMAIAYPDIKIRLVSNGTTLFSTQGKGDVKSGILTVYSKEMVKNLLPVSKKGEFLSITGYICPPSQSKSNKKMQIFFVNGRSISSKVIEKGVFDAYLGKLMGGRHPICFLFINIMPEKLDVNIHPNKKEVRFDDESIVSDFVASAIKEALLSKEALPEIKVGNLNRNATESNANKELFNLKSNTDYNDNANLNNDNIGFNKNNSSINKSVDDNYFMKTHNEQVNINKLLSTMREEEAIYKIENKVSGEDIKADSYDNTKLDIRQLSITGSLFATYITALDDETLYLIDQHAAHERIFFEQFMHQFKSDDKPQQLLLVPFVVNVSYAVKEGFNRRETLHKMGFEIEDFGARAFIVKAVPIFMSLEDAQEFVEQFLENASETADFENSSVIEKIMMDACKSSVKANNELAGEEMQQLLNDLAKCENPYSCPHGRPTFIKLTKSEIEKMFKRKV